MIPLSSPDISDADIEAVTRVLQTSRLSLGPRLLGFENALASWVGAAHGVAVSSGTAGLHLALRACGVGRGDEVITSPLSFVASANAILYDGAVPVFADVDHDSLNIDPEKVEAAITPRTRAILVVHLFGRPAAMGSLLAIADRHHLAIVEDACEALGAETNGRRAGTLGACGVFAFYPNKVITTGEGGMIVTDDPDLAASCRAMRSHGRTETPGGEIGVGFGYNYRLSELACALGLSQFSRIDAILARREHLAWCYQARLAGHDALVLPDIDLGCGRTSWFVYVVRLAPRFTAAHRDRIVADLQCRGIAAGRYFAPLHLLPHLAALHGSRDRRFRIAEAISDRTIALPFFNRLTEGQIDEVCQTLLTLVTAG